MLFFVTKMGKINEMLSTINITKIRFNSTSISLEKNLCKKFDIKYTYFMAAVSFQ